MACQTPLLSSLAPVAALTAPGICVAGRRHASQRRRYSSSKPSSSNKGSKNVAPDDSVPASVTKPNPGKKKRGPKGIKATVKALPSVPSTNHLSQQAIALTSFFSLHRPISVTEGFPSTVSDDTFATIFKVGTSPQTSDVISTLSDTVEQLEQPVSKLVMHTVDDDASGEKEFTIYQHVEGAIPSMLHQLKAMSGRFSPFMSPPTPQDVGEVGGGRPVESAGEREGPGVESMSPEMMMHEEGDEHVQYKAVITIDQTTKPDGRVEMVAHSPKLIFNQPGGREIRGRRWMLISVKRIRKLKMKKKKYKKLMKKTRNVRRKLDKL